MATISISRDKVRTLREVGGVSGARSTARAEGQVFLLLADGRGRLYYSDGGRVRVKTWARASLA